MTEPNPVDQRALGRVQADRQSVADLDHLPTERESVPGEHALVVAGAASLPYAFSNDRYFSSLAQSRVVLGEAAKS